MTTYQIFLAFLYFFIVLVILPIFCSEKVYSVFYQGDETKADITERINMEYRRQGVEKYLENMDPHSSRAFHEAKLSTPLDNLIIVMAKRPKHPEDLVLSQLVTEIDRSLRAETFYRSAMFICNTTRVPFAELDRLAPFYPVRPSENTTKWKLFNPQEVLKHDFVDCVTQGMKGAAFNHVTLVRDVVVPYAGSLSALNYLLANRLSRTLVRGDLRQREGSWLFLHLHEPVAFRHYEMTSECLRELLLLAIFGGGIFTWVFRWFEGPHQPPSLRATYAFYGALYFLTLALSVGRPYVSEVRRAATAFYRLYDPPLPAHFSAMALPATILPPLLTQLDLLRCSAYTPFHEVLDHMVNTLEAPAYVVSPSLFRYVARG